MCRGWSIGGAAQAHDVVGDLEPVVQPGPREPWMAERLDDWTTALLDGITFSPWAHGPMDLFSVVGEHVVRGVPSAEKSIVIQVGMVAPIRWHGV